jgi:hypothetical protein
MPRKSSTKTDSPAIKKNKSSYMFFCADNRQAVKDECPDLNNKQIITELGARWKKLKEAGESEKLKGYETLAAQDKDRYLKEKSGGVAAAVAEPVVKEEEVVVVEEEVLEEEEPPKEEPPKKAKKEPKAKKASKKQ